MALQAGKLDRRITIQRATLTYDDLNNPVETWADHTTVWGAKLDYVGSENVAAHEVGAQMTTAFRIRWSNKVSDVNPKDRLSFDSKTWNIENVKEIGRKEGLEISAIARTDD
jgi:SPP1 family predicted phage head-tail adaptor